MNLKVHCFKNLFWRRSLRIAADKNNLLILAFHHKTPGAVDQKDCLLTTCGCGGGGDIQPISVFFLKVLMDRGDQILCRVPLMQRVIRKTVDAVQITFRIFFSPKMKLL